LTDPLRNARRELAVLGDPRAADLLNLGVFKKLDAIAWVPQIGVRLVTEK